MIRLENHKLYHNGCQNPSAWYTLMRFSDGKPYGWKTKGFLKFSDSIK